MSLRRFNALIIDDEPMAREILQDHLAKIDSLNVVASCKNSVEGFSILNKEVIDLIFLDINMPEIDGLSFAKTINPKIKVIFTTAYREYAMDGFELQAVDFLLKPISFIRLSKAVSKFIGESTFAETSINTLAVSQSEDYIFVRADRKMIKIDFDKILYVESFSDYIKLHTIGKVITTRETISNMEAKLPNSKFLRCHRSFIVSISKIDHFTHEYIDVANNAITISRSYKDEVQARLGNS